MTNPYIVQAPDRHRGHGNSKPSYSIAAMVTAYAIGLAANALVFVLAPGLLLLAYPLTGIALNRFISRRVRLWRQTNSVGNVARSNARMMLVWPVSVPAFLVWLGAAKFL